MTIPTSKPARSKPSRKPSRKRREPTAPNQPPPDAERDEFIALMGDLRVRNRPFYNALLTVLRLDAPARSAALLLVDAARTASMPVPPPQTQRPLVQEALLLFAEITDPAHEWATTAEAVAGTLDLALDRIALGDRARAGLVLASALEHATDDDLREVCAALKRDRDNMQASIAERAGRSS